MTIKKIITALVVFPVSIFTICISVKIMTPEVTVEPATVLSSDCGIVTVQTYDGNIYKCYGETDAARVNITLEDDRFIDFEEQE